MAWLSLASTPTFAAMALWTIVANGDRAVMLCPAHTVSPLSGMTVMYLLMAAFHSGPWLKQVASWRRNTRRTHSRA